MLECKPTVSGQKATEKLVEERQLNYLTQMEQAWRLGECLDRSPNSKG